MAQNRKSLREAMASQPERTEKEAVSAVDKAAREAIARESVERYRGFVANINRIGDREIERALQRS